MTSKTKTTTTKGNKAQAAAKPTEPTVPAVLATEPTQPTQAETPVTIDKAHVRATLENAAAVFNDAAVTQAALNAKRDGGYVTCLAAAREATTADVLSEVWESLKADIRKNVGEVATRLGCILGKADKDGNADYKVPGSLSTAMSVILGSMRAGCSLIGKDGKPMSFGEVRQFKAEADEAAAKVRRDEELAKASPAVRARAEVARLARLIAEGVDNLTETEATEAAAMLLTIYATMSSEGHAKAEAKAA